MGSRSDFNMGGTFRRSGTVDALVVMILVLVGTDIEGGTGMDVTPPVWV